MPADDVSDLRDVFDAIDRLCETMKSAEYEADPRPDDASGEPAVRRVDILTADDWNALSSCETDAEVPSVSEELKKCVESTFASAEDVSVQRGETRKGSEASAPREVREERGNDPQTSPPGSETSAAKESPRDVWSDCPVSPPGHTEDVTSDTERTIAQCEPISDMYYTASSEVSLLSDTEPERAPDREGADKEEGKEFVPAGHVAFMRERFESMTRANTPCPDLVTSASPSLDVFRITPSPDRLG